ncbi:hypothetical protein GFS24_24620 [Chitinophaga sp. SYP-B3965]|uniref:BREX system ATP-binding domain-containing protein n=1 Tax=Chitinophaga sp. SYP-B3965 TaxID=2663120 RepID=UPI001299D368|nr:BREX system ATP-binding domain-containing protein [Chitinophaga sp. SYP-B3965]MRG48323.1 hypothetical protein [Chitinophaga sp. SYP-B3965]
MKLLQILENYDIALLDQLSTDKIDEAINLRLPQAVIVQEIISALSSQSYISNKILYGKPPTFAILNLILQSPDFMVEVEGFRTRVLDYIKELSTRAAQNRTSQEKNAQLYVKILRKAWENDGLIDKSEAHILELVKQELGIWDREHFTLIHDESIISMWDIDQEYYQVRNQLLTTGIILTHENKYVIADEVAIQIRKSLGIDIMDDSYKRLLASLSKEDMTVALNYYQLNVTGSKDILIERLLNSLIPPAEMLGLFHLEDLRELCRRKNIQVSGAKNMVIANIIQFFDEDLDLHANQKDDTPPLPPEPELREMDQEIYGKILANLTGQQLYDILNQNVLMTSGSKDEKIRRILDSHLSERSVFHYLRKEDLGQLCRKFGFPVSGSKQELIDRVLDYVPSPSTPPVTLQSDQSISIVENIPAIQVSDRREIQVNADPVAFPPNWDEINSMFTDLEQDEKIVLAILKEAKSITEQDLSRIVVKYKLGWFLHKAHMAELMAKLKRDKKPYIQIKSVQNANIYQWVANENSDDGVLEKRSARDIIDALRHGVVPRHNLGLLMVGQQTARNHLSEILLEVNSNKSHFKFIRGQYGSGKTFLCSWLKEFALSNEFAVSFMNISHDQPLSDLPIFFSGMINGLRTPEKTDSSSLVDILESWLLNIHNKTAKLEGVGIAQAGGQHNLSTSVQKSIEVELANLSDIEPGFSMAMRAFYEGKVKGDMELVSNAVAWITGSRALSSQALRDIGVKGYLEANNVFPRMRAILEIISGARYKGLLLLVDELELVRKFPHVRQREQALETLRLLIDEAGRNALPGCLVIFTGTDEFFEDERYGLKSYEALAERVMTPFTHESFVSMRQPIISLESLDQQRLTSVLVKIRDLYGIAYSWDAKQFADDEVIVKLIEEWTVFGEENIDRKPRPVLREFIQMLDLCEENKGVNLSQFLKKPKLSESTFNTN